MNPTIDIRVGDALKTLRQRPAGSVDCVVTSPPYWGLRDYGTGAWDGGDPDCDHQRPTTTMNVGFNERWGQGAGERKQETKNAGQYRETCAKCGALRLDLQMGLEPTPDEYVANVVEIFRELWRVLADHGTVWLNLGDSYSSVSGSGMQGSNGQMASRTVAQVRDQKAAAGMGAPRRPPGVAGIKPKDLIGIPWATAFALRDDGWYLRMDIIWSKRNPMPESITDRPTKAHEYLFLLAKRPRYYYDRVAIREPAEWARWGDQTNGKHEGSESAVGWMGSKTKAELQTRATPTWDERKAAGAVRGNVAFDGKVGAGTQRAVHGEGLSHDLGDPAAGRNKRSVWEIATEPYAEAHFATFPTALVEPCVKAGCPERVCKTCGKPSTRIIEATGAVNGREREDVGDWIKSKGGNPDGKRSLSGATYKPQQAPTGEWTDCGHDNWRAGVVLDPFMGSGTSLLVARRLGRSSIGIELNPDYANLARRRLARWWQDPLRTRDEQIEGQLALELAAPE